MENKETDNFIDDFCKEILLEAGIEESSPKFAELLKTLGQRIDARIFLELVAMLSPDQAAQVTSDMEKESSDPKQLVGQITKQIPNFQLHVAQILSKLRSELLDDLKR